jgi:hypothetical protein
MAAKKRRKRKKENEWRTLGGSESTGQRPRSRI